MIYICLNNLNYVKKLDNEYKYKNNEICIYNVKNNQLIEIIYNICKE